jgi:hypothetical protein
VTTLHLERAAYLPKGTFGRLYFPGGESIWTLECPWENNVPNISCIPEGLYGLTRDTFKNRYPNYRVVNPPPGRYGIEIHIANYVKDLQGCIGVGLDLGTQWNIMNSEEALDWMMEILEGQQNVLLHITHYQPSIHKGET